MKNYTGTGLVLLIDLGNIYFTAKYFIFQPEAVIKNTVISMQYKAGLLCFTSFHVLYFRRLILIFLFSTITVIIF